MQKQLKMCLLILMGLSLSGLAVGEEITLTSCNWEPYNGKNLPGYGFTSQIIAQAFERVGYKVNFVFLPWKRAVLGTEYGKYEGAFAAYYSKERAEKFAISAAYTHSSLVLCAKKDTKIKYKTLQDLKPYRIGVVMGYVNTTEFDAADFLKKDGSVSDILNLKKLVKDRTDLILIDKYVAMYHLNNDKTLKSEMVYFLKPALKERDLYILFSKKVPGYQKRVLDFNKGLATIKADGTFKTILTQYGF